ncbi:MAG: hypothetical protein RIT06_836 [Chloroflexota bacterium]|jgi:UDP-GlcNAc:undecaprenyl-phosphate GlcNAc-1-phosphate transferase
MTTVVQPSFIAPALYLVVTVTSCILALVGTGVMRRITIRYGIADHPNERRINTVPVPRAGGFAVAIAFAITGATLMLLAPALGINTGASATRILTVQGPALVLGTLVAAILGLIDDRYDLRARWQLLTQIAVALVPIAFGIRILFVANPLGEGILVLPDALGTALTIFWLLGMQNSMNFIDGLDGLSGGIALIAAVTLGLIAAPTTPLLAGLCFALAGSLAGFLRFNFHPASIYMGTSGIQAVAFILAMLAMLGTAKVAAALLILGVPIIDAFFVIVGRIAAGRSPYSADNTHIHRRLLAAGLSHRGAVFALYGITGLLGLAALSLSENSSLYAFAGLLVALGGMVIWLSRRTLDS